MRGTVMPAMVAAMVGLATAGGATAACRTVDGKPRFEIAGEVARDRIGAREWRRCALGSRWTGTTCAGEALFLTLDEAEAAVRDLGGGWRLPDVKELYELLDDACGQPPVDTGAFPDAHESDLEQAGHWTSTPVGLAELWFYVDLGSGVADGHSRGFRLTVRPVRGGGT